MAENVERIDAKFLRRFDEFNAFVGTSPTAATPSLDVVPQAAEDIAASESTPDELLRATIKEVESALAAELIARICIHDDRIIHGRYPWLEIECSRCSTPRDVDLAGLKRPATTFVHDLVGRLVCQKCSSAGKRPAATLLQLAPRQRHRPPED